MLTYFLHIWKPIIEILILWFVFYRIMLFFEGTRALQVLRGIIVIFLSFLIFQKVGLYTLDWLLTKLFAISVIALLIIFQPEIRQGLARLGQRHLFNLTLKEEEIEEMFKEIINACNVLASKKIGALIVIEREDQLKAYTENALFMDSKIKQELIEAIFHPSSILHDGGLIIQQGRITFASAFFPLTDRPGLDRMLGTRHRAAIGLTEETDAIAIIVSEETGSVSICVEGRLYQNLNNDGFLNKLKEFFKKPGK
ncbi:MAG: diadenylate cyclase CdaA [Candidatus Omnitrophota bacterium]